MSLENVLVTENQCKIIDFGMCLRKPQGPNGQSLLMLPAGQCGKRNYMSPEIYANTDPFDGLAVDLWACAVMLFIMLTGVPPFELPSMVDQRFRMVNSGGAGGDAAYVGHPRLGGGRAPAAGHAAGGPGAAALSGGGPRAPVGHAAAGVKEKKKKKKGGSGPATRLW
eukprot:CAMPEP_0194571942 /NCGR_PEP_ID=MMETSP0292-20121207/8723_1 /TAXON_ID=39354 /ORGANISM="Heterosigma akashiwo, Strain CCMP2393" /LENGTH=166 /DNA_ID=CAMNT_0039422827 /DNA_START=573 /DNA_END=1072 /DNA_ORIENTATION=-